MKSNGWLIAGGVLSLVASALHIGCIVGGADWYRFFGAGEDMARLAEQGSIGPAIITLAISIILAIWAAYAFAGAGMLRRLPLMRAALVAISLVYLGRGLILFPLLLFAPREVDAFVVWSSLIVLAYGVTYALGTWRAWPVLSGSGYKAAVQPPSSV